MTRLVLESVTIGVEYGHQVFDTGQNEYIRLISILVLGESFIYLARYRGKRKAPTEPSGLSTVAFALGASRH
jgi:hypothetical protein